MHPSTDCPSPQPSLSPPPPDVPPHLLLTWNATQARIASSVIPRNHSLNFHLPLPSSKPLVFLGTDISFSTTTSLSIATLTGVLLLPSGALRTIYSSSHPVTITTPYVPGYLSFREAPHILALLSSAPPRLLAAASALLVDGNGVLHPRRAGLACHVGVEARFPTIGVGKTLMCLDGLVESDVRDDVAAAGREGVEIRGRSGEVWGRGLLTGNAMRKPLFVSVGHRVGLETAVAVVRALCRYRVPEPIRLADLHSREALGGKVVHVEFDESSLGDK